MLFVYIYIYVNKQFVIMYEHDVHAYIDMQWYAHTFTYIHIRTLQYVHNTFEDIHIQSPTIPYIHIRNHVWA